MKTATVADLRNQFSIVAKWVNDGETVTITKRGEPFAKLVPVKRKGTEPKAINRMARLRKIFPDGPVRGDTQQMLSEERGDR